MDVKTYTMTDGQYFKVINKSTGAVITYGELTESNQLVTIHKVEFISEENMSLSDHELNRIRVCKSIWRSTMTIQTTLDTIAPLGHTIIAVSAPPAAGADTTAWIDHLTSVSDSIEQRPAILVVPFSKIEAAEAFADQVPVKSSYRVICPCYHGATGQEPEIAAAIAAVLADSNDPALPFNGVNLGGLTPVADEFKLTFERMEATMNKRRLYDRNGCRR